MDALSPTLQLPLETGHEGVLEGKVARLVYDANNGSMRVFEINDDDGGQHTIRQYANGVEMIPLKRGDHVRATGKIVSHPKFGKQFQSRDVIRRTPTTPQGIAKLLSGKAFKGIGPKAAQKLADSIGSDLVSVLNRGDPGELVADLIGEKKAKIVIDAWLRDQATHMVDAMLLDLGVGPETRKKIREKFDNVEYVVQHDPYRIHKEIEGVGFKTADEMAQRAGIFRIDSPQRLSAGVRHALETAEQDGHTGLGRTDLVDKTCELLLLTDRHAIATIVDDQIASSDLSVSPNGLIQNKWLAVREARLARNLVRLGKAVITSHLNPVSLMRQLRDVQAKYKLNDLQNEAVVSAVHNQLSIVTGGPGTGKTTAIKAIIDVLESAAADSGVEISIRCVAPTAMAADRINESTGHPASTVHSALGVDFDNGGFAHNEQNPFQNDVIIADEWSMMDTRMADAFFQAIDPKRTRVIIVGDVDQIPSVDAGRVLYDMIESKVCPVTRFTHVYRTGPGSSIAIGAQKINAGQMPDFGAPGQSDLVFIEYKDSEAVAAAERIVKMVSESLPKLGYEQSQIQVLAPGKNSAVGVNALNLALRDAINPGSPAATNANGTDQVVIANNVRARLGDRLMCTKNSYGEDVSAFNGDRGVFDDLSGEGDAAQVHLECNRKRLKLERAYWRNLTLAYAITVHKSQGSEFPVVVIPMTTSHYMMLKRNLFYTAVTRAKALCIVVGSKRAINLALTTMDGTSRQTGLLSRIRTFSKHD